MFDWAGEDECDLALGWEQPASWSNLAQGDLVYMIKPAYGVETHSFFRFRKAACAQASTRVTLVSPCESRQAMAEFGMGWEHCIMPQVQDLMVKVNEQTGEEVGPTRFYTKSVCRQLAPI